MPQARLPHVAHITVCREAMRNGRRCDQFAVRGGSIVLGRARVLRRQTRARSYFDAERFGQRRGAPGQFASVVLSYSVLLLYGGMYGRIRERCRQEGRRACFTVTVWLGASGHIRGSAGRYSIRRGKIALLTPRRRAPRPAPLRAAPASVPPGSLTPPTIRLECSAPLARNRLVFPFKRTKNGADISKRIVGFGRRVASEREAPNMLAGLVYSGRAAVQRDNPTEPLTPPRRPAPTRQVGP